MVLTFVDKMISAGYEAFIRVLFGVVITLSST